ncbi:MAG: M15 family metallopeptidase [Armatimonadota bacterium]
MMRGGLSKFAAVLIAVCGLAVLLFAARDGSAGDILPCFGRAHETAIDAPTHAPAERAFLMSDQSLLLSDPGDRLLFAAGLPGTNRLDTFALAGGDASHESILCLLPCDRYACLSTVSTSFSVGRQIVAVISHTYADHTYRLPYLQGPPQSSAGASLPEDIRRDIFGAAAQADCVIVFFSAHDTQPLPVSMAREAIDAGADVVVCRDASVPDIQIYHDAPIIRGLVPPSSGLQFTGSSSPILRLHISDGRWRCVSLHLGASPVLAQAASVTHDQQNSKIEGARHPATSFNSPSPIVHNTSASPPRNVLLKGEAPYFSVQSHPSVAGMSVVHFLAWDLHSGRKTAFERSVVVAADVADEVRDIFRDIYLHPDRFPIHEVIGYDYRTVTGGRGLSYHALGRAIDINRAENPMIKNGRKLVHPDEPPYVPGEWQPGSNPYSITPDGPVVRAFREHGWSWGGEWTTCKDYQHFQKPQ